MDIAQQRIKKCIEDNGIYLDLSHLGLVSLPSNLPSSLQRLHCSFNQIKELPCNLPGSLQELDCSYNQIKFLPSNLPASLQILICHSNQIKVFPSNLPTSLQGLYSSSNQIIELPSNLPALLQILDFSSNQIRFLPSNLPASLQTLHCSGNPHMHITKTQALKYNLSETPNFNEKAREIQRRWRLQQRIKRLKFCKQLHIHSERFLLRPGNYLYCILLERNKGVFSDL